MLVQGAVSGEKLRGCGQLVGRKRRRLRSTVGGQVGAGRVAAETGLGAETLEDSAAFCAGTLPLQLSGLGTEDVGAVDVGVVDGGTVDGGTEDSGGSGRVVGVGSKRSGEEGSLERGEPEHASDGEDGVGVESGRGRELELAGVEVVEGDFDGSSGAVV